MNKKLPFLRVVVFCFCFISSMPLGLSGRGPLTLTERTQLRPVAWKADGLLWFAPGSYWVDDWEGGVQSGTLDQTVDLQVWNTTRRETFGPGFIRFERAAGGVKEGTLANDSTICVVNTASASKLNLTFVGKTATVEFGYDGCVMKGTLATEATLKSWNGDSKSYPPGTLVEFNGAGEVVRAVLPSGAATTLDGSYTGTCTLTCPVKWLDDFVRTFAFNFTASGGSFVGGDDAKEYSLQWQGNYDAKGIIRNGMMTGWIDFKDAVEPKLRWTISGPIDGTLAAPAAGTLSVFTAVAPDRPQITCNGAWNAAKGAGLGPIVPTTEGTKLEIKKGAAGCLDLIFVIDQTSSMSDDIDQVKKTAKDILATISTKFPDFRVAIVGYRDWGDAEMFKDVPFSSSSGEIQAMIDSLTVQGGGDEPEAVIEALLRAIRLPWRDGCNKQIILMGDAPPHSPVPQGPDKGKTADDVVDAAEKVDPAVINTILIARSPGSFSEEARKAFEDMSSRTKGTTVTADKAEEVPKKMMDMVEIIKKATPAAGTLPVATGGGGGGVVSSSGSSMLVPLLIVLLGVVVLLIFSVVLLRRRRAEPAGTDVGHAVQASLEVFFPGSASKIFEITSPRTAIGRAPDNQLVITDPSVSLHHAEILASSRGFMLRDLGSANGTQVNGKKVSECPLYLGDEIVVGSVRLELGR